MKEPIIKWRCLSCGMENESYPLRRHDMTYCKCGQSGVDAEEHYLRQLGDVVIISGDEIYDR